MKTFPFLTLDVPSGKELAQRARFHRTRQRHPIPPLSLIGDVTRVL